MRKQQKHTYLIVSLYFNNLIFSGGFGVPYYQNNILEFDIKNQDWAQVGNLSSAAYAHGVSVVNFADFEPWCQKRSLKFKASLPASDIGKGEPAGSVKSQ